MSIVGLSMAVLPCRAEEDVEAGSAALRVDWPVYPRRAEHNTVAEGGNRRWAETAPAGLPPRSDARSGLSVTPAAGSGELADDPAHRVRDAQQDRVRRFQRSEHDGWVSGKSGKCSAVPAPVCRQGLLSQHVLRAVRVLAGPLALRTAPAVASSMMLRRRWIGQMSSHAVGSRGGSGAASDAETPLTTI